MNIAEHYHPHMKNIKLIQLLFGLCFFAACSAQPSSPFAPEAGSYSGASYGLTGSYQYGYNAITGFGMQPSTQVNVMPSPLGDMIVTATGSNKGNYSFAKAKDWSGSWQYNPQANTLTFTGKLAGKLANYRAGKGYYTIDLKLGSSAADKDALVYSYSKKASKPFPKPIAPNGNISGSFTLMPDIKTVVHYNATGKTTESFNGSMAATNRNHYTLTVGYTDDPHYYQVSLVQPDGNMNIFGPEKIKAWQLPFADYKFGVLAEDNATIALLGKMPDSYRDLRYIAGDYVVAVIDTRTGTAKSYLPMLGISWIKPDFIKGGGIAYSPKEGGIAVTDASFKNKRIVYNNPVNALAVSPDGKRIAFSEGLFFYTMNIDGSNKTQIVCEKEPLQVTKGEQVTDMCWSPDGKYIAFGYGPSNSYNIVIVPLDGGAYQFLNDDDGEPIVQKNPLVSWH